MKINTNSWNRIRYTIYLPIYDIVGRVFTWQRKKSVEIGEIKPSDRILIVGAGTGLDLEFLQTNSNITAIDITPVMIRKLKHRAKKMNIKVNALVGDGQQMNFQDNSFDIVFLHLILAVIPDPVKCIKETERVLKRGGRVMIFDKFLADGKKPGILRKSLNMLTNLLASNINLKLKDILAHVHLKKNTDLNAGYGGIFRIVKLQKL
jgi:phosphatidylethanolamine/phosphatidyl-N-methylethanolamine N-methyltransferase